MKSVTDNTEQNFDERETGVSSTSKYFQKSASVEDTPDGKIINTNLKKVFCETFSFKPQTMTVLGVAVTLPLPFIKTKTKNEIGEVPLDKDKLQYGNVICNETKGGFVELKSQTPKNKIWQWLHPSGTYRKYVDDGSSYDKVTGDTFFIFNKNWNVAIGKDFIELIDGDTKIQIKKNYNLNVGGDFSVNIDGNSNTNVGKDQTTQVGGNSLETVDKNKTIDVTGSLNESIKKDHTKQVNGSEFNTTIKDRTDVVCGGLNILVSGDVNISSNGTINLIGKRINLG